MGNKIICDNETNNTRFKNESLSRRSIRGTDLKTARTELSQTVNDPLITKEIHSILKTFKQKHLTELFPLLNETEKCHVSNNPHTTTKHTEHFILSLRSSNYKK